MLCVVYVWLGYNLGEGTGLSGVDHVDAHVRWTGLETGMPLIDGQKQPWITNPGYTRNIWPQQSISWGLSVTSMFYAIIDLRLWSCFCSDPLSQRGSMEHTSHTLGNVSQQKWISITRSVCVHIKGLVTHTITNVQRSKNKEFWTVRCDASEFVDDLTKTSDERYSFIVCVNLCAHFLHVIKNLNAFQRVNVDARKTSDQRQSNARHK